MTLHLTEQVMKINETLPVFELIKTSIIRVQITREEEKKSRINTSSMLVSVSSGSQGHRHLSQS